MTPPRLRATLRFTRARVTPMPRPTAPKPRSPVPLFGDDHTEDEWAQYLDSRARGITPDLAAREIGLTGSRMRAYLQREPERAKQAAEAAREGDLHYQERLRATARILALDTDAPNPRILEVELATHTPGYEHLRRDRVKHEGHVTHGIVIDIDPDKLDGMALDRLRQLRELLGELGGEVIDGEAVELREIEAA